MKSSILGVIAVVMAALAVWYITQLQTQIADLQSQLAAAQAAPPAPPPTAVAAKPQPAARVGNAAAAGKARSLSIGERAAMVSELSAGGAHAGRPVWFTTTPGNAEAAKFQKLLQSVFEEAGWEIKGNRGSSFPIKAGIYFFAADLEPPDYVRAVSAAFEAAGVPIASSGNGYRDYYAERKAEDPNWRGFEMTENQSFVLAIGRAP